MNELEAALIDMRLARKVHLKWADSQKAGEELFTTRQGSAQDIGGDEEWHRKWVAKYDRVIKILEQC